MIKVNQAPADLSGNYQKPGLAVTQALMNADSSGLFAVHFHCAEKGMRQW